MVRGVLIRYFSFSLRLSLSPFLSLILSVLPLPLHLKSATSPLHPNPLTNVFSPT